MKLHIKCPRTRYYTVPYVSNIQDTDEELSFAPADISEDVIFSDEQAKYTDLICELIAHSDFKPATIKASYRNETEEPLEQMSFHLYDNSSIDMNGIVSSIDIVVHATEHPIEKKVVYTKKFKTTQSGIVKVHETNNCSGIDTVSDVNFFAGAYKPNMPLSDIQPYLFYLAHNYNDQAFISIVSATDFLNSKNNLIPAPDIKFEDLSTLYDDIVVGKVQITLDNINYKSISAIKNTLTNSLFTIRFERII